MRSERQKLQIYQEISGPAAGVLAQRFLVYAAVPVKVQSSAAGLGIFGEWYDSGNTQDWRGA
ncbi:MAG: hypothetical protein ACKO3T_05775 [Planctomycetaceae bacterium]